jgi:hypothetical protein
MKVNRAFGLSSCVFLFLSGCHKHATHVTFIVAPSLQQAYSYAESGATLEWYSDQALGAHGFPFTVDIGNLPCQEGGQTLKSDGKKPAICHLKSGETGSYLISFAPNDSHKDMLNGVGPVMTVMHVGPCNGCTTSPGSSGKSKGGGSVAAAAGSVYLDCDDKNNNLATPANLSASVGDQIYWTFVGGHYPPQGKDPFDVTLDPGVCSNYPSGTTIKTEGDFCTVAKSTTYQFTVYGCNQPVPPAPHSTATIAVH